MGSGSDPHMTYPNTEIPPAERRVPMREGRRVLLIVTGSIVFLVLLAVTVDDAGPGRLMTGGILLFFAVWFVMVLLRGTGDEPHHNRSLHERPPGV